MPRINASVILKTINVFDMLHLFHSTIWPSYHLLSNPLYHVSLFPTFYHKFPWVIYNKFFKVSSLSLYKMYDTWAFCSSFPWSNNNWFCSGVSICWSLFSVCSLRSFWNVLIIIMVCEIQMYSSKLFIWSFKNSVKPEVWFKSATQYEGVKSGFQLSTLNTCR